MKTLNHGREDQASFCYEALGAFKLVCFDGTESRETSCRGGSWCQCYLDECPGHRVQKEEADWFPFRRWVGGAHPQLLITLLEELVAETAEKVCCLQHAAGSWVVFRALCGSHREELSICVGDDRVEPTAVSLSCWRHVFDASGSCIDAEASRFVRLRPHLVTDSRGRAVVWYGREAVTVLSDLNWSEMHVE